MINPVMYFGIFLKASLFSSGGLSNLPSLRRDLIGEGWAEPSDFGHAVAVGQLSPGPTGLWAVSLGYLSYGWLGTLLALIAIALPPLLVLPIATLYGRIERLSWVPRVLGGLSTAVAGVLVASAWVIVTHPGVDWRDWLIFSVTLGAAATRRFNVGLLLVVAAATGCLLYR